jgi:hypothetical protein
MVDRTLFVAGDPLAATPVQRPVPTGIPFTQHLMPDGRTDQQWIDRPPEVEARARALIALGCTFHVELLSDWITVSLTVEHPDSEMGDIAIELAPNGPAVLDAVDRLVAGAESYFEAEGNDDGDE